MTSQNTYISSWITLYFHKVTAISFRMQKKFKSCQKKFKIIRIIIHSLLVTRDNWICGKYSDHGMGWASWA